MQLFLNQLREERGRNKPVPSFIIIGAVASVSHKTLNYLSESLPLTPKSLPVYLLKRFCRRQDLFIRECLRFTAFLKDRFAGREIPD